MNDTLRESHYNVTNKPNTVILYSHDVIPWIKDSRNLTLRYNITSSEPNAPLEARKKLINKLTKCN